MRRAWRLELAIALAALAAFALPVAFPDHTVWTFTYAIWAFLLYEAMLAAVGVRDVWLSRTLKAPFYNGCYRLTAGDPLEILTVLHRSGWSRFFWLIRWRHQVSVRIQPRHPLLEGIQSPGVRRNQTVRQRIEHVPRGRYELGHIEWSAKDVFGVQSFSGRIVAEDVVLVHPKRHTVMYGWSFAVATDSQAENLLSAGMIGTPFSVRPYRRGDRLSQIHWPATAHRNQVMTREWHDSVRVSVIVCLDTNESNYESAILFEWTVSVFASLLQHALETGVSIVGYIAGDRFEVTRKGIRAGDYHQALSGVMDMLADVRPTAHDDSPSFPSLHNSKGLLTVVSPKWRSTYVASFAALPGITDAQWIVPSLESVTNGEVTPPPRTTALVPQRIELAPAPARPDGPIHLRALSNSAARRIR